MLNVDEAALFDALYSTVICPIFYTEVLADLEKVAPGTRSPEKVVQDIARKTPVMHSTPNMLHAGMCLAELGGQRIEMRRVPVRAGGVPVRYGKKVGVIYDEAPEAKAFNRWQEGRFHDIEREFASAWRAQLKCARHADMAKLRANIHHIRMTSNFCEIFEVASTLGRVTSYAIGSSLRQSLVIRLCSWRHSMKNGTEHYSNSVIRRSKRPCRDFTAR